jgi:hypothetical protein
MQQRRLPGRCSQELIAPRELHQAQGAQQAQSSRGSSFESMSPSSGSHPSVPQALLEYLQGVAGPYYRALQLAGAALGLLAANCSQSGYGQLEPWGRGRQGGLVHAALAPLGCAAAAAPVPMRCPTSTTSYYCAAQLGWACCQLSRVAAHAQAAARRQGPSRARIAAPAGGRQPRRQGQGPGPWHGQLGARDTGALGEWIDRPPSIRASPRCPSQARRQRARVLEQLRDSREADPGDLVPCVRRRRKG